MNDVNALTSYTSGAAKTAESDTDDKPDVVAPGGSSYYSKILSADSNSADADSDGFADVQANDYTSISGTSMAAPMVAGSAALLIQALEAQRPDLGFRLQRRPVPREEPAPRLGDGDESATRETTRRIRRSAAAPRRKIRSKASA